MRIESENLILRAPIESDVVDLVEGLNNINVVKFLSKLPFPYTNDSALYWVNKLKKEHVTLKEERESFSFNIELKSESKIVGCCSLDKVDFFDNKAEIGYWVNEKYWRRGIITEAVTSLIQFAFSELELNRLTILAFDSNSGSKKVAEKLGFTYEGTLKQYVKNLATNLIHDACVFGLVKEDWVKK